MYIDIEKFTIQYSGTPGANDIPLDHTQEEIASMDIAEVKDLIMEEVRVKLQEILERPIESLSILETMYNEDLGIIK